MPITQKQHHDAALIQAYKQGDHKAIDALILRHKDKIFTTIYVLVKDKYLAEDIFQEAMLKLLHTLKREQYNEQGKFLSWAIRIAHNLCMDHFRKNKRNIPVTFPDGKDIFNELRYTQETPENRIENKQTCDSIRCMIESLPEEQRTVVALRIYGELSFKQIAALTNTSINTALGRMRYALINLRKKIEEQNIMLR
jgi:RNA polymerase sigma factor (sigma-70 family)